MKKALRDLQKLYKWAMAERLWVRAASPQELAGRYGECCTYISKAPLKARIRIREGLYPEKRLAVLAHELGHYLQGKQLLPYTINKEIDAWTRAEILCEELGIKTTATWDKLKKQHIDMLKTEKETTQRRSK